MQKNLNYSRLLDYYGAMLTEKQCDILKLYYNEDLSLSEISEIVGSSRQGVMDIIHRALSQLDSMEAKLHLSRVYGNIAKASALVSEAAAATKDAEVSEKLNSALEKLSF